MTEGIIMATVSIKTNILIIFLVLVGIVSFSLLFSQYYFNKKLALESAHKTFHIISKNINTHLSEKSSSTKRFLEIKSKHKDLLEPITFDKFHPSFSNLVQVLQKNSHYHAIYFAHTNGKFYEILNMRHRLELQEIFHAPQGTHWMTIVIIDHIQENTYLNKNFEIIAKKIFPKHYVVQNRPWYSEAIKSSDIITTMPYLFTNSHVMGTTYAKKLKEEYAVLAIDYTMEQLNRILATQKSYQASEIFIISKHSGRFASSSFVEKKQTKQSQNTPFDAYLSRMLQENKTNKVLKYSENGHQYFVILSALKNKDRYLGIKIDADVLMKPYMDNIRYSFYIAFILLLLALPLIFWSVNRIIKPIKLLILENSKIKERAFSKVKHINSKIIEFNALSNSQVSMSKSIHEYEKSQEALLDGFIKVIAEAIDKKSPYTGKHCARVPEIAQALLHAANEDKEGLFKTFSLTSKEALREFEIGAWLHDCGKVTTPEYVVDKSTKLETIYNRIHEIRMRFEVLWRDVHILYLQNDISLKEMQDKQTYLHEDFAFIASCNLGAEFMEQSKQERIKTIAQITWQRYFDDTLGLGHIESQRYAQEHNKVLPVTENLLNDKKYHIIKRENFDSEGYKEEGFKLEVPEHLYNYGEIYNLCIDKGTLSAEERYKISEHVIMSIKMLEKIPFPPQLSKIPEYAGTHHETLIGTGYPKKLSKKDLSIPARIMAIADIFEALTASDRPYKKGKKLSESIHIMSKMVKNKHIDPDLFKLFLNAGVYLTYAEKYMQAEQIDEVNITQYLSPSNV